MKLVEIIPALQTSPETIARARAFVEAMGKEVTVSRDSPGFISNRLLMPYINEAIQVLEEVRRLKGAGVAYDRVAFCSCEGLTVAVLSDAQGVATKEDIDKTMKLGMAHPMGPLVSKPFSLLSQSRASLDRNRVSRVALTTASPPSPPAPSRPRSNWPTLSASTRASPFRRSCTLVGWRVDGVIRHWAKASEGRARGRT